MATTATGGDINNVGLSSVLSLDRDWLIDAFGAFFSTMSPGYCRIWPDFLHQPAGKMSREVNEYQHWLEWPQPSKVMRIRSRFTSFTVAGQISSGFLGSTASILCPTLNSFLMGLVGTDLKQLDAAKDFSSVVFISFSRNLGHLESSLP